METSAGHARSAEPDRRSVRAPPGLASGYRDPPTVETTKEALVNEETAPAEIVNAGGAVAAPVRSYFQTCRNWNPRESKPRVLRGGRRGAMGSGRQLVEVV